MNTYLDYIKAKLGHAPEQITPGAFTRFSTNGKPSDKSGWCKLFDDGRGGVFGCYRQGISETWSAASRRHMNAAERTAWAQQIQQAKHEREQQQRQQWAENAQRITRLWAQCRPLVPGDPVTLYMKGRLRSAPWPLPGCLRYHPGLSYWHDDNEIGTFPAMVAAVTSPAGELLALHRTWLTRDGRKASVPGPVKKLTATAGPLSGGCIRLSELGESGAIGIAEGIETAMAAGLASGLPVCAAYSAGNLSAWQWPAGTRHLVIFADADPAGRSAADHLRNRAHASAVRVSVMTPTTEGADWCDVWASRDATLIEQGSAAA